MLEQQPMQHCCSSNNVNTVPCGRTDPTIRTCVNVCICMCEELILQKHQLDKLHWRLQCSFPESFCFADVSVTEHVQRSLSMFFKYGRDWLSPYAVDRYTSRWRDAFPLRVGASSADLSFRWAQFFSGNVEVLLAQRQVVAITNIQRQGNWYPVQRETLH